MALRIVVENTCVALELELAADTAAFARWQQGQEELKFGWQSRLGTLVFENTRQDLLSVADEDEE